MNESVMQKLVIQQARVAILLLGLFMVPAFAQAETFADLKPASRSPITG